MKIAAFFLCWTMVLTAPGVMAQQTIIPNQSWDVLRQLQAGAKAAGNALSFLAVPGAILGSIVGARKNQAGVREESMWLI